jgi:hypothetical protein
VHDEGGEVHAPGRGGSKSSTTLDVGEAGQVHTMGVAGARVVRDGGGGVHPRGEEVKVVRVGDGGEAGQECATGEEKYTPGGRQRQE